MLTPEEAPSDWVVRWTRDRVPARALDLAAGHGRHARFLRAGGWSVTAIDRDAEALAQFPAGIRTECLDLETEAGWDPRGQTWDLIVVTRYLHRPLFPAIRQALAPGGCLIYETFMQGHEQYGRPQRPEFLLRAGELLQQFADWYVVAFEQGLKSHPSQVIQRICVVRPPLGSPAVLGA